VPFNFLYGCPQPFSSPSTPGGFDGYDGERAVVATYDAKVGTHQPILVKKIYGKWLPKT